MNILSRSQSIWCIDSKSISFYRQTLTFIEIEQTAIVPVAEHYLHRGSVQFELAPELLRTPLQLVKITNPQAQVEWLTWNDIQINMGIFYFSFHFITHRQYISPTILFLGCGDFKSSGHIQYGWGPSWCSFEVCGAHSAVAWDKLGEHWGYLGSAQDQTSFQVAKKYRWFPL